jgi:hypothetical protein
MTRSIVGVLLLANLALFGWMRWSAALTVDADAQALQPALNADRIRLLEHAQVSAVEPAPNAAPRLPLTPSPAPAAPVPVPASVASAPAPASATPPATSAAPVATAKKAAPKAPACAEWGEFSGSDLARAQRALAELKLGAGLTQRGVEQDHGYWVYIPPLKKRADVDRKIAQLKQRGVNDYFVVQEEGEWQNAISLGVFRTEEAAQRYLATLRTKRVRSAKVGERMSKLRFTVFVMKSLDAETVGRIEALRKEFPDSELKVSACGN